jgi:hypothetical protein
LEEEKNMPITVDLEKNPIFAKIFKQYSAEGEKRGEKRGVNLGKSGMLQRLLEKRFHAVPDWVKTKLEHASDAQLDEWGMQLFDAQTLEDVFNQNLQK